MCSETWLTWCKCFRLNISCKCEQPRTKEAILSHLLKKWIINLQKNWLGSQNRWRRRSRRLPPPPLRCFPPPLPPQWVTWRRLALTSGNTQKYHRGELRAVCLRKPTQTVSEPKWTFSFVQFHNFYWWHNLKKCQRLLDEFYTVYNWFHFFHCLKTLIYFSKILKRLKIIWVAITDSFRIPQNGCQIFWEKYPPLQYPLHTLSKVSLMYSSVFFVCFMKNKINTGEQGVTSLLWTFSAIQVHRHWGLPTAKTNPIRNSCILILSFMLISNIASFMWNQIS